MTTPARTAAWTALDGAATDHTLSQLFDADADRLSALTLDVDGLHFDWSKTHLTRALVERFAALAEAAGLAGQRERLFAGAVVNPTEGRAATHPAERGSGEGEQVALAARLHERMAASVNAVRAGVFGPVTQLIHIGIGGSALGPELLVDALGADAEIEVAVVSNIDGLAIERACARFDPATTLVAVASKTFTTTETLTNAAAALDWMRAGGVRDPLGRFVALTAAPDKAVEWGIDDTRVLPFADTVGGRYSLWSSIGFPAALALGGDAFAELLDGAAAMDRHFREAPLAANAPALAAFADLYYAQVRRAETRATFAYDERLRLLPAYLQQLEMESNGKGVTAAGEPLDRPSAPIVWGGVGTDAQHAVFQLLHQGTHLVPVEFVVSVEAGDDQDPEHHRQLLLNALAQGAALMAGRANGDAARAYSGDRPSSTILLDDVTPFTLGALLAFYEHRVFVRATLLGINPFDQFGVELGKEMARSAGEGEDDFDPSTRALLARAGL